MTHPIRARVRLLVAALVLAIASIGVGVAAAEAHTPSFTATCSGVTVSGTSYEAKDTNVLSISLNGGPAVTKTFATSGSLSVSVPQGGATTSVVASVKTTNSNPAYSKTYTATVGPCGEVPPKHTTVSATFVEGSVVCEGTEAVYTNPSYTKSGEHVSWTVTGAADFGADLALAATPDQHYLIDGPSSFKHTFDAKPKAPDCRNTVTPVSPTVKQDECTGPGQSGGFNVTLPANADGIKYTLVGNVVTAHIAVVSQGTTKFGAHLPSGWTRVSDVEATYTVTHNQIDCTVVVHPAAPAVTQDVCTGPGTSGGFSITPVAVEGVSYAVNGLVVTASAKDGYRLGATDGWTAQENGDLIHVVVKDNAGDCLVQAKPAAPKVVQSVCKDGKPTKPSITTVPAEGVVYTASSLNNDITATPATGYFFPKGTQTVFKVTLVTPKCEVPKTPLPPQSPPTNKSLAFTGANVLPMLLLSFMMIGAGALLVRRVRPRAARKG